MRVEVVYALPDRVEEVFLDLPVGATVQQAVEASGLLLKCPEIDLRCNLLGIYAKVVKPETRLRERDRVEIYRPLLLDPKELRRRRAAAGKLLK